MTAFQGSSFDTVRTLQRGFLRLYSLTLLFLGRCNRFLRHRLPILLHVLLLRLHIVLLRDHSGPCYRKQIRHQHTSCAIGIEIGCGRGTGESIRVRVRWRGECAPLVVDLDGMPAAFRLGGAAGRSASESSSA